MERLIDINEFEKVEKEKEKAKKRKLYNDQMDDLDNFNRRKNIIKIMKSIMNILTMKI